MKKRAYRTGLLIKNGSSELTNKIKLSMACAHCSREYSLNGEIGIFIGNGLRVSPQHECFEMNISPVVLQLDKRIRSPVEFHLQSDGF